MRISFRPRLFTTTRRRAAAIVLASALSAGLTSCTGTADPTPTSTLSPTSATPTAPLSPSPSQTLTAEEEKLKEIEPKVLAAYHAYWDVKVEAYAKPNDFDPVDLIDVATGDALNSIQRETFSLRTDRVEFAGAPVLSPVVTGLDGENEQKVTIQDCVDVSNWQPVFIETSESAAQQGQGPTRKMTAIAEIFDGHWVISSNLVNRDASC